MGYSQNAAAAYSALDTALMTPGRAEARVFSKITSRMEIVFADKAASASAVATVLHDNRKLWQAAAVVCASDHNAMPRELRAGLIGLAAFVDRHTSAVLRKAAEPGVLCEINRRVAAGLSAGAA